MLARSLKLEEFYAYVSGHNYFPYDQEAPDGKVGREMKFEPVIRVNAIWVDKPVRVKCRVANTAEEKRQGLQGADKLGSTSGMFFPYNPRADVCFHQGSVSFPLDLIFLRNDKIIKIQSHTKVGSKELWRCSSCDGVIEVRGGFCSDKGVSVGDDIAIIGLTESDMVAYLKDRDEVKSAQRESSKDRYRPDFYEYDVSHLIDRY